MTDRELYLRVREDALAGNPSRNNRAVVAMLDSLAVAFGDQFTIDGAVATLDGLVRIAELWKSELRKAKGEAQP